MEIYGENMGRRFGLISLGAFLGLANLAQGAPEVAGPAEAPAAHAATHTRLADTLPEVKPSVPKEAAINSALQQTGEMIANSNLWSTAHDLPHSNPAEEAKLLFDLVRRQHREKSYTQASRNCIALLEGVEVAEELKSAALIELAVIAQEQNELAKAQQLFAQYLKRYPQDPSVPEVYLRQGLLYRQMGAPTLALSKFYAVMTSALTLRSGKLDYYQRLVLHAQTEIADTYYLQGKYQDATEFFQRLLKQDRTELNKIRVQFKLIRSLDALNRREETVAQAEDFLTRYPDSADEPEVRFVLANALKSAGRKAEAVQQVLWLLKSQQKTASTNRENWAYWQRRAGNEIANQLYQESDYLNALEVYSTLALLDASPSWQLPAWYQVGLVYEKLQQPQKATESYARVLARQKELDSNVSPGLRTILDMARWRTEFLGWQTQTERTHRTNLAAKAVAPSSTAQ
jgi:tetratricopeptide (TPR) repeat protein